MLPFVPVPSRGVDEYREPAGEEAEERVRAAAEKLSGARILHVNSTAFGGGVAELLFTQVALLNDLGIETAWQVIEGTDDFFTVTKFAHNGLQGAQVPWTEDMETIYFDRCRANAAGIAEGYDYVLIHDPQPAGILPILEAEGSRKGTWLWRCHIDLSAPHRPILDFFIGQVAGYDAAIFTLEEFVPARLEGPRIVTIAPSIDPLSLKNGWVSHDTVYDVLNRYGVDRTRPIVTQVSRFDPWKDPVGVIDAYRLAKQDFPDLQLLLVGSMAHDDPEGWHYLEVTEAHRDGDPDIYLLSNIQEVGNLEVNAFQRASTVVVQKSLREGFGLVVSEAMWKETPVVAGNVGGIRLQIEDGVSGYLVNSVDECAERIVGLLGDDHLRTEMGKAGRERVRQRFLTLREIEDHLLLLASL
ncbi:MAG: glycosyltransferase [Actinomycetota bacterium]